jgi:hypothetical protein
LLLNVRDAGLDRKSCRKRQVELAKSVSLISRLMLPGKKSAGK